MLGGIWILWRDGQPAGYLVVTFGYSIEFGGRDAIVDELFVAEPHRHYGIGRRALDFAARACRDVRGPRTNSTSGTNVGRLK